jgi:hypothetical protein
LVCSGRAPERKVLALGLARARCGTRSSGANGQQNKRFWGSWALERVVLGQPGPRTRGSGAAGLQNGRFWRAAGSRTVWSAAGGLQNGWFWHWDWHECAVELEVLAANRQQNEERGVLARLRSGRGSPSVNGPLSEQEVLGRRRSRTGRSGGVQVTGWGGLVARALSFCTVVPLKPVFCPQPAGLRLG